MKFSQELIVANLRKRAGEASDASGVAPKKSCRRGPARSTQPPVVLPEAILIEEGRGEKDPPAGIPLGLIPHTSPPASSFPSGETTKRPTDEEEPSGRGAASPPPAPLLPGGAEAPAAAGGSRSPSVQSSQPVGQATAYKGRLSETVLKLAVLPKFQAKMRALPMDEYFDTLFTAALQTSNGLFVVREDLVSAKSRIEGLNKELSEAQNQKSKTIDDLKAAQIRESKALSDLRTAQENNQAWREVAERESRILNAKLSDAVARLSSAEERLRDTLSRVEFTENRADSAEAAARDAAEKLALAEKETKEVLEREAATGARALEEIAAAEARAQEKIATAEERARRAVELYKSSPDFASECSEAVMDAFVQGFERCKRRLSRLFKLGDLEHLRPVDEEETSAVAAGDEAGAESATVGSRIARDPAPELIIIEDPTVSPDLKSDLPGRHEGQDGV